MKYEVLMSAVRAAQLLMVIRPMEIVTKKTNAGVSQLRAHIDQHVAQAVIMRSDASMDYLLRLSDSLWKSLPVNMNEDSMTSLNSTRVLEAALARSGSHTVRSMRAKSATSLPTLRAALDHYIDNALAVKPIFVDRNMNKAEYSSQEGMVWHAFASIVRNSDWNVVLSRLGIVGVELDKYNAALMAKHGTRQGLLELNEKIGRLAQAETMPRAQPVKSRRIADKSEVPVVVVDDTMFVVSVCLTREALANNPVVIKMMQDSSHLPPGLASVHQTVGLMLAQACVPVTVEKGKSPEKVVQHRMDTLIEALSARNVTIQAQREKLRKEAVDEQKEKAVSALRDMDSSLLKVLKANPELLTRV